MGDKISIIKVKIGEDFSLSFDASPTTGYTWEPQFNSIYIRLDERKFEPSSELIGAGGKEKFKFSAVKAGETEIAFIYKRPWEKEAMEKKEYKIIIE